MKRKILLILGIVLAIGLCACAGGGPDPTEASCLSLETLTELVENKGGDLSWSDFEPYDWEDVGSGLYIRRYPMNGDCYLMIGGSNVDTPPMYIRLVSAENRDHYIDVRTQSIEAFLNTPAVSEKFPAETGADPKAPADQAASIDFRCLHRGFTAVRPDDRESFDAFAKIGMKVILTEEDWHAYMDRFCPGIPYFDICDFSKECLLASVMLGAKPAYVRAGTITRLGVEDGHFVFEYGDDPTACLALNTGDTAHFYVEVLIISREDLPAGTEELVFHPETASPAPNAFWDILAGDGSFYSQAEGLYMTIEEYCCSYAADHGCSVAFTQFAAADVNADGVDEIVLWLSNTEQDVNPFGEPFKEGVLILHRGQKRVEGHFKPNYDLYDLKADGTFRWCGKHGSSGAAYLDSSDSFWCRRAIATEEKLDYSSPDDTMIRHADRAAYSMDESISDEEAYRQAMELQDAKEDTRWYEYPCEDLDVLCP